jgi:hypothetical protein
MSSPEKADPTMYRKMRDHMLRFKQPGFEPGAVQKVLMDWHVGNGTATILAELMEARASISAAAAGTWAEGKAIPRFVKRRSVRFAWPND